MLGWDIAILRPADAIAGPLDPRVQRPTSASGAAGYLIDALGDVTTLMSWSAYTDGLTWIDPMQRDGKVITVTEVGYPSIFAGLAGDVTAALGARASAALRECDPSEWVVIEAWDQS